jgi:hypothetical protein
MAPDKKFISSLLQFVYEQGKGSMAGELLQGQIKGARAATRSRGSPLRPNLTPASPEITDLTSL